MQYLITILLAFIVSVGSLVGAYNYAPLEPIKLLTPQGEELLGTSITTIQSSDTLKNSRTTINDNFTALNAGKIEISTTSLPLITTLAGLTTANALTSASSLATVGTITSGTWSGTAIAVAKGGTGTTSPSLYSVLLGNGANGLTIASGTGTTGQFLTSNGAGAYPSWQTSAVNQADDYDWTGTHTFATTTFSGPVYGIHNLYFGDGSDGASTTAATTTLARDMYFTDLTVANGTTLITNGFKVYVKNTTTFVGTGRLWARGGDGGNGGNASGNTPGSAGAAGAIAYSSGTLPLPLAGVVGVIGRSSSGAGNDGVNGGGNKSLTDIAGVGGGNSGAVSCNAAGTAGTAGSGGAKVERSYINSIFDINFSNFLDSYNATTSRLIVSNSSGSGASGSKGQDSGTFTGASGGSGGSGASGGAIFLASRFIITSNGNVYANAAGGSGGNAGNPACTGSPVGLGGSGGGGGGNGGAIILIYTSKTGTGTTVVTAGSKGIHSDGVNCGCSSVGDGSDGTDGNVGKVFTFSFN